MSFGVLELAQALGDRQALLDRGRNVIRFSISSRMLKSGLPAHPCSERMIFCV